MNTGDTAWLLISAALVMLMTPALGFFYGGMVRKKNLLSTIMFSFAILALISIQWILYGYTLSFGPDIKGIIGSLKWLGLDAGVFWSNMQASVDFHLDIINGIIKSVVFGLIVTWIAVFQGYDSQPTSAGIASATTRSVVYSSLAVLGLDFVLTAMMIGGW